MEIKGKIISILPLASGTSAKGTWKKQEYILQTTEQYPKKICFVVWGDKIDEYALNTNDSVEVSIDIESREYNGRWYTDVKAWKVVKDQTGQVSAGNLPVNQAPMPTEPPMAMDLDDAMGDDLPF